MKRTRPIWYLQLFLPSRPIPQRTLLPSPCRCMGTTGQRCPWVYPESCQLVYFASCILYMTPCPHSNLTLSLELWRAPLLVSPPSHYCSLSSLLLMTPGNELFCPSVCHRLCIPLLSSSWLDGLQQGSSACPSQDQLGVAANPKTFIQAAPPNFRIWWGKISVGQN